jgi:hypothetical protein
MKNYLLCGFATEADAKKRSQEIAIEQGITADAQTKYWFGWVQIAENEWALSINEGQEGVLSEKERNSTRFVEVPGQVSWQIMPSVLYRYLDKKYIDEFFQTGKLRLSSFSLFSKHDDEQKGDKSEGQNVLVALGSGHTVMARTAHGHNAYILSTSYQKSETLIRDFGSDGYFKITNSIGFGIAISKKIPGFKHGIEGPCHYETERIVKKKLVDFSIDNLKHDEDNSKIDLDKLMHLVGQMAGLDVFFVKLRKYQHQLEHRFVWLLDREADDYLFVECPEALEFCEIIE